ncbi:hypothetical protein SCOR_23370 [Sulfidibacter corallicola]|uniref:Uncharacterized protein n=1 Tax=Sulfidibacter corallicola TaxID=2818388 RepID=A0A8A4TU54_SULCO|nr:hypothetical protein [Sulfidibacter corallicola]QTD52648.1 hypothetical protein J3U87_09250 [Sulfidibacter corallicola]
MQKPIGLMFNGVWSQHRFAETEPYRDNYELVYTHGLTAERLAPFEVLVVPFQSNRQALSACRHLIFDWLTDGRVLAVFGDNPGDLLPATWEDRPIDNYWWKTDPTRPPIAATDRSHPLYGGLASRHGAWHHHGVYTAVPDDAWVIQRTASGEAITWQTSAFGGTLFASTKDPIVEYGVDQIRHLDHYMTAFTEWVLSCVEAPSPAR